jgi:Tn3 transposase DDE domain
MHWRGISITGRINARELHEQMNSCSCLTLLLACVVYWQAKEVSRVLKMGIPEGEDINIGLLEHVSPIEWENVILYGQCAQPGRHSLKPTLIGQFGTAAKKLEEWDLKP